MSDSPHDGPSWYGAAPFQADTETVAPGVQLIRIAGDLADALAAGRESGGDV